ncbi:MAG: septum formation inhibitor [Bacteroidetes bacterium]|nr:MAG: septum formation inhibitor [Bacteroidota bacterium]
MLKQVNYVNKYKFVITLVVFAVWMLFFDGNSALFINKQYNELLDLRVQERFLKKEINEMNQQKIDLFSDNDKLERYAREHYYFKKDNEDVYVIEEAED